MKKIKNLVVLIVFFAIFVCPTIGCQKNDVNAKAIITCKQKKQTKTCYSKYEDRYVNYKKEKTIFYKKSKKKKFFELTRYDKGGKYALKEQYYFNKKGQLLSNGKDKAKKVVYDYYGNGKVSKVTRYTYNKKGKLVNKKVETKKYLKNKPVLGIQYASKPLSFKSIYNTNHFTHPSVINLNSKWNGYQYWLAITPYKNSQGRTENPHVYASNNMVDWIVPNGAKNPLDVPLGNRDKRYNSDTHLIYNEDKDQLELFWRYVDHTTKKIITYKKTSKDGRKWSQKKVVYVTNTKVNSFLSPSVVLDDNYKLWYAKKDGYVYYINSNNGVDWSKEVRVKLPFANDKLRTWHLDVKKYDDKYEMLITAFKMRGHYPIIGDRVGMDLYYSESEDGINWTKAKLVMKHSNLRGRFDGMNLYRSSYIKKNGKYALIYSGFDYNRTNGVSLAYGDSLFNLKGLRNRNDAIATFQSK
ncbi:hypothetical protein OKW23_000334 [Bacilli bacterium PM5-9]|nr:hypothetical protein [Bacilli bacterium PM5-9]